MCRVGFREKGLRSIAKLYFQHILQITERNSVSFFPKSSACSEPSIELEKHLHLYPLLRLCCNEIYFHVSLYAFLPLEVAANVI